MASATSAASNGGFATLVGRLYSIWTLDALVEIGYGSQRISSRDHNCI
jgi:hypothetical protein